MQSFSGRRRPRLAVGVLSNDVGVKRPFDPGIIKSAKRRQKARRRTIMEKKPFVTLEQIQEMVKTYPTPFHLYDEKGIRENARKLHQAFAWNKGYKEYFAVKATPNPFILSLLYLMR